MSERIDELTDDVIARFLRARSADPQHGLVDEIVRVAGTTPQDRRWPRWSWPMRVSQRTLAIASIALLLVTIGAIAVGTRLLLPSAVSPFLGAWAATGANGSTLTMAITSAGGDEVQIEVHHDRAAVCSDAASTMTGAGRVEGGQQLVIASPEYTCDGGGVPVSVSGPPLEEQLQNLTFVYDADTDAITDSLGTAWGRVADESPSPEPDPAVGMWPQANLEEVRQAQELADAGDPAYTWQRHVDEGQLGQNHPCSGATLDGGSGIINQVGYGCWRNGGESGEIFVRFLQEKLGWDDFLWTEATAHHGFDAGDVVFVRCAAGQTNALYPNESEHPGCAPTIDELRYETVKISLGQPDRLGPTGIWVVTGWELIEPETQADPRVVQDEASRLLEAFLQARIDGQGAEGQVQFPEYDPFADVRVDQEIPLLYATSSSAPYERSSFELVAGPTWPNGRMQFMARLFADNGETVVQQFFAFEPDDTGRLRLVYDVEGGPAGPGPGTTENGKAAPEMYGFLDGEVTYLSTYPLGPSQDAVREWDWLSIDGLLPDDDAPRRILTFLADPRPSGSGCDAPPPADAETVARSIASDPDFDATAVAVTVGGHRGLQVDGVFAPATSCGVVLSPGSGRTRLFLFDLAGRSARVLGIAISADGDSFETVLEWATPIVNSIEFHAP